MCNQPFLYEESQEGWFGVRSVYFIASSVLGNGNGLLKLGIGPVDRRMCSLSQTNTRWRSITLCIGWRSEDKMKYQRLEDLMQARRLEGVMVMIADTNMHDDRSVNPTQLGIQRPQENECGLIWYICRLLVSTPPQERRVYLSPSPRKGQLTYDGVGQRIPKEPG